jgi:hypothetical protein
MVENAMGTQALALLAARAPHAPMRMNSVGHRRRCSKKHPDCAIMTSFPGLADSTGARVQAEIGDDGDRFAGGRAVKAYAGSAPVTRRPIKNNRWPMSAGCGPISAATVTPAATWAPYETENGTQ